jgi:hypothetical protein
VTPFMITILIVVVVAILIVIGYLNNVVEANKLQKSRLKLELTDRLRRAVEINETFPGQFVSADLKHLFARLELNVLENLVRLDKRNRAYKERIDELQAQVALGDKVKIDNPKPPITTEAYAKHISYLLESLHGQLTRATKEGFLTSTETKRWVKEIKHILVLVHIEFFNNLGQQALSAEEPGQARLAFERGVHYLKNQPEPAQYDDQLKQLQALLTRTNSIVMTNVQHQAAQFSELNAGLQEEAKAEEDADGEWKKKRL